MTRQGQGRRHSPLDTSALDLEGITDVSAYAIRAGAEGVLDRATGLVFVYDGYWRTEMEPDQRRFQAKYLEVLSEKPRRILSVSGSVLVRQLSQTDEELRFEISRADFNQGFSSRAYSSDTLTLGPQEMALIDQWGGPDAFFAYVLEGWRGACTFNAWRPSDARFVVID